MENTLKYSYYLLVVRLEISFLSLFQIFYKECIILKSEKENYMFFKIQYQRNLTGL